MILTAVFIVGVLFGAVLTYAILRPAIRQD
jgi:hypothetical protein